MELEEAILGRRSIRIYNDKKVEKDILQEIIQAGTWAPSACNIQGWKFIIIDEKKLLGKIVELGSAAFLRNVNQAILVLYDNRTDNLEYSDYIQSGSACIQNILLKAYSLGVGTCWINNLPEKKKLKALLNIPWNEEPIALISVGYYDQKINMRERKHKLEDLIAYNSYTFPKNQQHSVKLLLRRFARKIYKKLPCKKFLFKFASKFEKKFDN